MKLFSRLFCLCLVIQCIYSEELRYSLLTASFDSGAVAAIEFAEKLINADSSILPGYNLTHNPVVDTEVSNTETSNDTILLHAAL